jgi:hypothetical protein
MRKLFTFIVIILLSIGCGDKRPGDVLPADKMKEVMWDMLKTSEFLDGYLLYRGDSTLDKAATITAWYNKVYQLHNVSRAQFDKSYAWYQDRPKLMKEMLDSLSKRQYPIADSTSKNSNILSDSLTGAQPTIKLPTTLPQNLPIEKKRERLDSMRRMLQLKPRDRIE